MPPTLQPLVLASNHAIQLLRHLINGYVHILVLCCDMHVRSPNDNMALGTKYCWRMAFFGYRNIDPNCLLCMEEDMVHLIFCVIFHALRNSQLMTPNDYVIHGSLVYLTSNCNARIIFVLTQNYKQFTMAATNWSSRVRVAACRTERTFA